MRVADAEPIIEKGLAGQNRYRLSRVNGRSAHQGTGHYCSLPCDQCCQIKGLERSLSNHHRYEHGAADSGESRCDPGEGRFRARALLESLQREPVRVRVARRPVSTASTIFAASSSFCPWNSMDQVPKAARFQRIRTRLLKRNALTILLRSMR
jgi:hypothetical protein